MWISAENWLRIKWYFFCLDIIVLRELTLAIKCREMIQSITPCISDCSNRFLELKAAAVKLAWSILVKTASRLHHSYGVGTNNISHSGGRKWKHRFDHLGFVQTLTRKEIEYHKFWHGLYCRNETQKQGIESGISLHWYHMSAMATQYTGNSTLVRTLFRLRAKIT